MDIEEFLNSGAFVTTARGPHFCQKGKTYILVSDGHNYFVKATEVTVIGGKETVIFQGEGPPGIVRNLENIFDVLIDDRKEE